MLLDNPNGARGYYYDRSPLNINKFDFNVYAGAAVYSLLNYTVPANRKFYLDSLSIIGYQVGAAATSVLPTFYHLTSADQSLAGKIFTSFIIQPITQYSVFQEKFSSSMLFNSGDSIYLWMDINNATHTYGQYCSLNGIEFDA